MITSIFIAFYKWLSTKQNKNNKRGGGGIGKKKIKIRGRYFFKK